METIFVCVSIMSNVVTVDMTVTIHYVKTTIDDVVFKIINEIIVHFVGQIYFR